MDERLSRSVCSKGQLGVGETYTMVSALSEPSAIQLLLQFFPHHFTFVDG